MREKQESKAILYVAATHLGQVDDIPTRSLDALRTANLLIFEEDRPARQMLKAAGVHREYEKYSEHREAGVLELARKSFKSGKSVCYMSDQGTPGLADPGRDLIRVAMEASAKIQVIPGPSSITAAISACPFDCSKFQFAGFPPRQENKRVEFLKKTSEFPHASVIMDTPYRLEPLLAACSAVIPKHRLFLALDISGPSESYLVGSAKKILESWEEAPKRLNFVLILE